MWRIAIGFLYGIPDESISILRFDPVDKTTALIPLDETLFEFADLSKWSGGVRGNNGVIYAVPYQEKQVLAISELK